MRAVYGLQHKDWISVGHLMLIKIDRATNHLPMTNSMCCYGHALSLVKRTCNLQSDGECSNVGWAEPGRCALWLEVDWWLVII